MWRCRRSKGRGNGVGIGLVSVVIPTYRRVRELRTAVASALAQTYAEVEVIVVADGPDGEARAAVAAMGERVRYVELAVNSGPAEARNAGMRASRGEWLTFLDDDDTMLPRKVECTAALADAERPTWMISCRTIYRRGEQEDVWPRRPLSAGEDVAEYILRRPSLLGRPGVLPLQTLLIHRSVLEQVPFTTHKDHEDWAWLLEAWHLAEARVEFCWEPLVVYNIATESISRSRRMNWADSLEWVERYRRWIGDGAYNSFLATKVALKAKRAGDWRAFLLIAGKVLRNRPGMLEAAFLLGVGLLPSVALQKLWKRSLASGEAVAAPPEIDAKYSNRRS